MMKKIWHDKEYDYKGILMFKKDSADANLYEKKNLLKRRMEHNFLYRLQTT